MVSKDVEETMKYVAKNLVMMKIIKNLTYLLEAHMAGDKRHQKLACRNLRDVLDEYEEIK